MSPPSPRIAILGFAIECNRFSPVTTGADFAKRTDMRGDEIVREARVGPCRTTLDLPGFFAEMDRSGPWTPVPLRLAGAQPGGPVDQPFFDDLVSEIENGLVSAAPLDGVYIVSHGAALSTGSEDPDGDLFAMIRRRVGPNVPVIGTFDLHANVSRKMIDHLDVFVGYLENPHTDTRKRGIEAARHMRELLAGARTVVEMVKLPLVPPSITLLTATGPYGDMIRYGQTRVGGDIINVSIMAGFAYSDCPKNGYTAVVTARNGNRSAAFELARELCERTWAIRERFDKPMTSLTDAVKLAVTAGGGAADTPDISARSNTGTNAASLNTTAPILLADVADNPGGGARGNTTWLLRALVDADARAVVIGVFNDAALAAEAHQRGIGATFEARFNRAEDHPFSQPFSATATVVSLSDGVYTGRRGMARGTRSSMGPSAFLQIGGVAIVVISNRQQCMDPAQLELLGVDIAAARTVVLKSRGHFRAGFDEFFTPDRIFEVDCPGLTSPSLSTFQWTRLPRPVYPLDQTTTWAPPVQ